MTPMAINREYITFGEAARHARRIFGTMVKPAGSACNLDCAYCYYLDKAAIYGGREPRMDFDLLERYIQQYIEGTDADTVTFVWHGGEPLMAGYDWFVRAMELQQRYAAGKRIVNTLQTNGTLVDERWCDLFRANNFLIGVSLDGPQDIHDAFRRNRRGEGTFDRVMETVDMMRRHGVEYNILATVNARSAGRGAEVYRFLRSVTDFIQFLPVSEHVIMEQGAARPHIVPPATEGAVPAPWSVSAAAFGEFMCDVFDVWVREDVGRCFVQLFDATLANYMNVPPGVCSMCETCGETLVVEHNGDVYPCDHFVYPEYLLGNIGHATLRDIFGSERQLQFGLAKRNTLPRECLRCQYRPLCHGECPKHRFATAKSGETGLNALCAGYKLFFRHTQLYMERMRHLLMKQQPPAAIMPWARRQQMRKGL